MFRVEFRRGNGLVLTLAAANFKTASILYYVTIYIIFLMAWRGLNYVNPGRQNSIIGPNYV